MWMINAAALCEYANNQKNKTIDANDIMRFPTIDAEPVRHGRWILFDKTSGIVVCDQCYRQCHFDLLAKYCRYCGAKMDGDESE